MDPGAYASTAGSSSSVSPFQDRKTGADPGMPGMSMCIVNHNGAEHLRTVLPVLRERADRYEDVVLVDDASTDDSLGTAERLWPGLRVIRRFRNGGAGAARNSGAAALESRRILFVDNDVLPAPDCVARLSAALDADPGAVIAMPRVVYARRPDRIQFEGAEPHPSGLQTLCEAEAPASSAAGPPRAVGSLITACFLLDRDRWGPHPLFDESFFYIFEDHELGLRARLRGLRLLAVPSAVCRHGDGTPGLSVRATGHATPTRVRCTILNRWQVILKLYQSRTIALLAPSLLLFELFQLAGGVTGGWLRHWLWALRRLVGMRASLWRRRREFQRLRTVPDRAVLRPGPHPFSESLLRRRSVRAFRHLLDASMDLNWRIAARLPLSGGQRQVEVPASTVEAGGAVQAEGAVEGGGAVKAGGDSRAGGAVEAGGRRS